MDIGRKIYYEKSTGNVLIDSGERSGSVVETTLEQDFLTYSALSERVLSTVGVISLPYGQDSEMFGRFNYHIDPTTEGIEWDLTPIQQEEVLEQATLAERITATEDIQAQVVLALVMGGLM